jgi:hypothetical protein
MGWYETWTPQKSLVCGTLGSLVAIAMINTFLFAMCIRWSSGGGVLRLSGRIHSIVGGLSGLPLVSLLLGGASLLPQESAWFGDMTFVVLLLMVLLILPISGVVLSRSDRALYPVLSNIAGLLSMFLGSTGFLLMWFVALAGFAA